MSPEHPEEDEFLEDDEGGEYGQRSIFATGWFRAILVLLVLAVIAVIAVPLIGGWFEPTPPSRTTSAPSEPAPTPPPPAATPTPAPAIPAPSTAAPPAPSATAPTPAPPASVATPAPARPEMPPSTPSKAAEKPTEHVATATPGRKSARPAATGSYWVQVGAFKESRNAEGLASKLRAEGFSVQVAQVKREAPLHVVRVGGYPDRARATAAREELQGKGHAGFVTKGPAK